MQVVWLNALGTHQKFFHCNLYAVPEIQLFEWGVGRAFNFLS